MVPCADHSGTKVGPQGATQRVSCYLLGSGDVQVEGLSRLAVVEGEVVWAETKE